jgi:hypothetical protein
MAHMVRYCPDSTAEHSSCRAESMEEEDDLIELARIGMKHAEAAMPTHRGVPLRREGQYPMGEMIDAQDRPDWGPHVNKRHVCHRLSRLDGQIACCQAGLVWNQKSSSELDSREYWPWLNAGLRAILRS